MAKLVELAFDKRHTFDTLNPMATTKTRINITLPQDLQEILIKLAKRDRIPRATKATKLLEIALELEEDRVWDALASERDSNHARYVHHRKAWR